MYNSNAIIAMVMFMHNAMLSPPNFINLLIWFSIKISMSALRTAMAVIQLGQTAATHLEALSVTVWKNMKRMRMMSAKVSKLCNRYYSVILSYALLHAIFGCPFLPFSPFDISFLCT